MSDIQGKVCSFSRPYPLSLVHSICLNLRNPSSLCICLTLWDLESYHAFWFDLEKTKWSILVIVFFFLFNLYYFLIIFKIIIHASNWIFWDESKWALKVLRFLCESLEESLNLAWLYFVRIKSYFFNIFRRNSI